MGDAIAIVVLCWVVGLAAYYAGKNDAAASVCQERLEDGRYVLQRVTPTGREDAPLSLMIDNHNRILTALCGR